MKHIFRLSEIAAATIPETKEECGMFSATLFFKSGRDMVFSVTHQEARELKEKLHKDGMIG